jgi:tetratricopeptide (TPR) repeat protein
MARLEEAVEAYRAVLQVCSRERAPLDWAATQHRLGNVLVSLSVFDRGATRLEEAVEAFREALKEVTPDHMQLQCAMTQDDLGNALVLIGLRESGTARMEEAFCSIQFALGAFREAGMIDAESSCSRRLQNLAWWIAKRRSQ